MGLELRWHCSAWSSGQSQEEAGRLHPRDFHTISRQLSPEQLLATVEPWCSVMSCPLSSAMLSPPQLATASIDCEWKLLAFSDAEDGACHLVQENLHLWPRSLRSLGFLDLARSVRSLPDPVGRQRLTISPPLPVPVPGPRST